MKKKSLAISWQVVTAIVIGLGVFWTIGKVWIIDKFFNRAYDKVKQGDYEEAMADYTEAIKLNPDDALAYYNRGIDRYDLKDYQGAHSSRIREECADFTIAIKLNPDDANPYDIRGLIYKKQGKKEEAREDFRKAKELYLEQGYIELYRQTLKQLQELE